MKKTLFFVLFFFVSLFFLNAQPVVNGIMQGSPNSFIVDPDACGTPSSWARAYYSNSSPQSNSALNEGNVTYQMGPGTCGIRPCFERLTRTPNGENPADPHGCYGPSHLPLPQFPLSWKSDLFPSNTGPYYEEAVMRVGHLSSAKCQKMEYYFIPDTNKPVLLVAYECVMQNGDHAWDQNPAITIQVFQSTNSSNTSFEISPINLGYYPADYMTNGNNTLYSDPSCPRNVNWPYSRYHFVQDGYISSSPDPNPPSPNYMTPSRWWNASNLGLSRCGGYGDYTSHKYVVIAFNLMEQARNQRAVKFQILMRGCAYSAHGAYLYYTAKMVPSKIGVRQTSADTVELSVPWGFDANNPDSYVWKSGLNKDTCVNMTVSDFYKKIIPRDQLMPYYRCEMESQTGVPFIYEIRPRFAEMTTDFTASQQDTGQVSVFHFTDQSSVLRITPPFSVNSISVPSDTVQEQPQILRWSWEKDSAWVVFAENEHTPVLMLPTPDHRDSIRVVLEVEDPESGLRDSVAKIFYYGVNTGVEGFKDDVVLYPNPNGGRFRVSSAQSVMSKIEVYDVSGRLLRTVEVNDNNAIVDIAELASGIYVVRINTDRGVLSKTVMKR